LCGKSRGDLGPDVVGDDEPVPLQGKERIGAVNREEVDQDGCVQDNMKLGGI
jgi:hypothetical protein